MKIRAGVSPQSSFSMLCFFIFPGSDPLIFLECPDKIAQIVETISICDLRDRVISGGKLITGLFDPLVIQIIHWSLMCHLGKETTEVISVTWIQRQKAAAVSVEKHNCAR